MNIQSLQPAVEKAVKEAGKIVLSYFNTVLDRHTKSDGSFATAADLASEKYLIEELKKIVPEAGFYAEESGVINPGEYMWVIDPLDGTTNFAQGIRYFCISVALTRNDERILGVVYQPCTDELFYATKGGGATLNGQTLYVPNKQHFFHAVISCTVSYERNREVYNVISLIESKIHSLRIMGASALDIAYCTAGHYDGVFFGSLRWWDIAAASLILEEAGGRVSTLDNKPLTSQARSFIGGSELIFKELILLISQ